VNADVDLSLTVRHGGTVALGRRTGTLLMGTALVAACSDTRDTDTEATRQLPATTTPTTAAPQAARATPSSGWEVIEVAYRVEVRTGDRESNGFVEVVEATLSDPWGWSRAGFRFVRRPDARFLIVLGGGDEVDRVCLPYDTYGEYSCQNGPVVALNAERWRSATPKWTGDVATYRQMLLNHEVGHLLGQRHPDQDCPRPGQPAPVMGQQSTELNGCLPNPWPLDDEIEVAARHDQPLAPPFRR
jgi:hypothetical protein